MFIDPSQSAGGSGTELNPYSLAEGEAAIAALGTGDLGGEVISFKTGTFARLSDKLLFTQAGNFTITSYGTAAKPILCNSAIETQQWQQGSGLHYVPQTLPFVYFYGTSDTAINVRLTPTDTLENCQNNPFTSFWDRTTNRTYVNMDGLNPNDYVMEYSANKYGIHFIECTGDIKLEDYVVCNAWDGNNFLTFQDGADTLQIYDMEAYQGGSQHSHTDRGNIQIIGATTKGNFLTNCHIERFISKDGFQEVMTLLYIKGGIFYDIELDNSRSGIGMWNDIVDCEFSKVNVSNIIDFNFYSNLTDENNNALSDNLENGVFSRPVNVGVDGTVQNNRFMGCNFVNCWAPALNVKAGKGLIFENCTFYNTNNHDTAFGGGQNFNAVVAIVPDLRAGNYAGNIAEVTLNNCLIIGCHNSGDANWRQMIHIDGADISYVHGDNNHYITVGDGTFYWHAYDTNYTSLALYQAGVSDIDQNSTTENVASIADIPVTNPGTLGDHPQYGAAYGAGMYLAGFDMTPLSVANGDAADSDMVGNGNTDYATANAAPTLGTLSDVVSGSQAAHTLYVRATWVGKHGETLPSSQGSRTVPINNVLSVAAPGSPPAWALGWNVYVGETSGEEKLQNKVPIGTTTAWQEPDAGLDFPSSDDDAFRVPTLEVSTNTLADATGETFQNPPDIGGIQSRGLMHPARFNRASGGWR